MLLQLSFLVAAAVGAAAEDGKDVMVPSSAKQEGSFAFVNLHHGGHHEGGYHATSPHDHHGGHGFHGGHFKDHGGHGFRYANHFKSHGGHGSAYENHFTHLGVPYGPKFGHGYHGHGTGYAITNFHSPHSYSSGYPRHGYGHDHYHGPAHYNFGYGIDDPYHGTKFGHMESREGYHAKGEYHVHLPDGRLQRVSYYTDEWGYHPTVTYEGYGHLPAHGKKHKSYQIKKNDHYGKINHDLKGYH